MPDSLLLVEDDSILAEILVEALSPLGAVTWKQSAEEALAVFDRTAWELVVTDVELPGMNGVEFLELARQSDPHVACLVLSSHTEFEYAVAAIRADADDYLTKPVDPATLLAKAGEMVALTRRRRAENEHHSVLAVGAHPDDVEIGCGGILLRHVDEGDEVTILTLTGGEAGGVVADRAREAERAAELLSARLIHADLSDTRVSVSDGGVAIGKIEAAIREAGADVVYTHTIRDVHQDHRHVHDATLVAARGVPHLYCYQAPSTSVEFHPTRFVAIDDFVDRKLEVIAAYGSQVEIRAYLADDLLRATARYWSRFTESLYVEPLEVVRDADSAPATNSTSSSESG